MRGNEREAISVKTLNGMVGEDMEKVSSAR